MESMPSYEGVSLDWALWYLSLNLLPLPIRSAAEVHEYMARHEAERPEWTDKQFADAREAAEKRPKIPWREGYYTKRGVTEADVREWFEHHPDRRIYLLTGVGSGLSVIDVDTYKGGDASPWRATSNTVVVTPQGGVHCWYAEREGLKTTTQKVTGIDPRGKGGGVVAPSGRSTPGRRFELFGWPLLPLPEEALTLGKRAAPAAASATATPSRTIEASPGGQPRLLLSASATDGFSAAVRTEAADGEKHERCKTIVGMLARWQALPEDAIAAALGLLDDWLGTWPGGRLVRAGWEQALRSSEGRSEDFTVEFVSLWNAQRCRPAWPDSGPKSAREIAASMWRTASSSEREAHEVAAGQRLQLPTPAPLAPPERGAEYTAPEQVAGGEAEPVQPNPAAASAQTVAASWLSQYATLSCDAYTADDIDLDLARDSISCASFPSWLGDDGCVDNTTPFGHGWGDWLDDAAGGGLSPGFLWILVARRAKGGKTAFVDQHLTGMQMLGALSLARGWGPVPLVLVVTEMPKKGFEQRGIARYIGFDQGMLRRGKKAELAPGVREVALRERVAPSAIVRRYAQRAKDKLSPACRDLWAVSRRMRRTIDIDTLEEPMQSGPRLIDAVGDIMDVWRGEFAREHAIDPARVVPYIFFDPVQRFCDTQRGPDDSLPGDQFIKSLRKATHSRQWITAVTSDTNQASARAGQTDVAKTPDAIVAQACRGTYTYLHEADLVCALDVLPLTEAERHLQVSERRDLEKQARVWVGLARWGAGADYPLPFRYFPRTGRFVATDPQPPPPPAQAPVSAPADPSDPTAHQDPPPIVGAVAPVLKLSPPRPRARKKQT